MGHQVVSDDCEEIKLKSSEPVVSVMSCTRRFNRADSSEFSVNCRKLRVMMNKVTEENFQKLVSELVETLVFDEKLINEFLKLLFDRVCAKDFSELYLSILTYLAVLLKCQDTQKFKTLKTSLSSKADSILNPPQEFSLPSIKFLSHLFIENLIKSKVLYTFLGSESPLTESRIEAYCTLLSIASPYLAKENSSFISKTFALIESVPTDSYKRKVQFLIQNILEQKPSLLIPTEEKRKCRNYPGSPQKKRVSFNTCAEFEPVLSKVAKRILKHSVSDAIKSQIKVIVADYVKGKRVLEPFQRIFEECKTKERQLVNQIFKYALIQFNRENEFLVICELVCDVCQGIVQKEVVETGIAYTVEAVEDLKLDTPMADQHLMFMINFLKDRGVIENSKYLLDHLNRPIEKKLSESSLDVLLSCDSLN